jgi:membrane protease YdiL (CAAX protease family)
VFEELIVRRFLTEELAALGINVMIAAVMTAILQASYHLYQGTWNAVAAFPLFLVFALYYAKTRRIWEIVLAHLWIDLMALAVHAAR